jgi:uncharacterized protein (DUF3084 family)
MLWTLLALASLVALGGFIAYYGDLQGRRWGKKRVSWLGLRPKHTAILITSLTGAFIALLSIGTLLAINAPVREVVLRGEEAIRENKQLDAQLVAERIANDNKLREERNLEQLEHARLDNAESATAEKQQQVEGLNEKLTRLDARERKLLQEYNARLREVDELKQVRIPSLQLQLSSLLHNRTELEAQNKTAGEINKEVGKANLELERTNIAVAKNSQELKAANDKLVAGNKDLIAQRDELFKESTVLSEANQRLLAGNRDQEQQAHDLQARVDQLNHDMEQLNYEFGFLSNERMSIAHSYLALRQGKFSLRTGAELARRTLDSHLSPDAVRLRLNQLLDEASAEAIAHGAARGDNDRAVRIVSKRALTLTGAQDADESASLDYLAQRLAASDTPVVVVANAVNNSVQGEQVLIELTPFAVRRVFAKDAPVAQCVIDSHEPTDRVFDSLVRFLNTEVRDAALKAGTIPQVDPDTGQQRIGSIGTSDLINLTERIRRMGGQVLVVALATDQTTSADPLRLTFKLARPPAKG